MKLKVPLSVNNVKTWEDLRRFASFTLDEIVSAINGKLSLKDNLSGEYRTVVFTAANADTKIEHSLSYVPSGYIVTALSAGVIVYTGSTEWSGSNIYLKATNTAQATLFIF
jgi:hypothetical protein